jgi:hypothetical protein
VLVCRNRYVPPARPYHAQLAAHSPTHEATATGCGTKCVGPSAVRPGGHCQRFVHTTRHCLCQARLHCQCQWLPVPSWQDRLCQHFLKTSSTVSPRARMALLFAVRRCLTLCFYLYGLRTAAGARTRPSVPSVTPIFTAGSRGYSCFRVPAAVRGPSGDLLVFSEARRTSCGDQAPKDIALSRSIDGGKTWSPFSLVIGNGTGNTTYRNPYPVFTSNGTLVLQFVNSTLPGWESLQVLSLDEGHTWGVIDRIGTQLGEWNGLLGGPGAAILLGISAPQSPYKGRLLGCGASRYDPAFFTTASAAFFSDDSGATWGVSNQSFPKNTAECQVAELPNASVLINFRVCWCAANSNAASPPHPPLLLPSYARSFWAGRASAALPLPTAVSQ